jgi:uncharacterized protein
LILFTAAPARPDGQTKSIDSAPIDPYLGNMRFAEDNSPTHSIQSYNHEGIVINDRHITHSVLVSPDTMAAWPPRRVAELTAEHIDLCTTLKPEIVIIGTGETLIFPPAQLFVSLQNQGLGVEIMANGAACRTFNVLLSEDRRVVLALMLDRQPSEQG